MAKAAKKTSRRKASPAAAKVVPAFQQLDAVRMKENGRVGVITGIADYHVGEREFHVRWRDANGEKQSGWQRGSQLAYA